MEVALARQRETLLALSWRLLKGRKHDFWTKEQAMDLAVQ